MSFLRSYFYIIFTIVLVNLFIVGYRIDDPQKVNTLFFKGKYPEIIFKANSRFIEYIRDIFVDLGHAILTAWQNIFYMDPTKLLALFKILRKEIRKMFLNFEHNSFIFISLKLLYLAISCVEVDTLIDPQVSIDPQIKKQLKQGDFTTKIQDNAPLITQQIFLYEPLLKLQDNLKEQNISKVNIQLFKEIKSRDIGYLYVRRQKFTCMVQGTHPKEDLFFFKNINYRMSEDTCSIVDSFKNKTDSSFIAYCSEQVSKFSLVSADITGGKLTSHNMWFHFLCLTSYIEFPIHMLKDLQQIKFLKNSWRSYVPWHNQEVANLQGHAFMYAIRRSLFEGFHGKTLTIESLTLHEYNFKWVLQSIKNQNKIERKIKKEIDQTPKATPLFQTPDQLREFKKTVTMSIYKLNYIFFKGTIKENLVLMNLTNSLSPFNEQDLHIRVFKMIDKISEEFEKFD